MIGNTRKLNLCRNRDCMRKSNSDWHVSSSQYSCLHALGAVTLHQLMICSAFRSASSLTSLAIQEVPGTRMAAKRKKSPVAETPVKTPRKRRASEIAIATPAKRPSRRLAVAPKAPPPPVHHKSHGTVSRRCSRVQDHVSEPTAITFVGTDALMLLDTHSGHAAVLTHLTRS